MAENTAISWADDTHNHWTGCTKVSPGCDHCYAEAWAKRSGTVIWGAGQPRRLTTEANRRKPLKWNAAHAEFFAQHGRRRRVFCSSLSDVFDNAVDPAWQSDLFDLIRATPNLDWLLLTKRIGNAAKLLGAILDTMPNVWLGATIVNREEADRDIPKLLAVPARVRFLSMEPLLGPVDIRPWIGAGWAGPGGAWCQGLSWVIVGGESGPNARPMHPDWARSLRDQCAAAGVPFHFKQWGEWFPRDLMDDDEKMRTENHQWQRLSNTVSGTVRVGKKAAGRLLDGVEHNGFPEDRP